jgi:hypothetical protein
LSKLFSDLIETDLFGNFATELDRLVVTVFRLGGEDDFNIGVLEVVRRGRIRGIL